MRVPRIEFKRGNPRDATARATGSGRGGFRTAVVGDSYKANWELDKSIKHAYEVLIDIFRCVDCISQNQAKLDMFVQRGSRAGGRRINDDQLEYVLNVRPNPYETAFQFRYRLSGQLLLSPKGAFIEVVPNRRGRPAELHLYHPSSVQVEPDPQKFIKYFKVTRGDGHIDEMEPDQVIWIRLKPHPTDPYAQMTPMQAAGLTAESEFLARIFNRSVVGANGKPEQLVSIGELLNDDSRIEIKQRLGGRGPSTAGGTTVIEATDVRVDNLMATPSEIQYLQGLDASRRDIYMAFGTPESVLGNAAERTYANANAEWANFWMETEQTHCDGIAAGFDSLTEGGLEDDLFVACNYNGVDVLQAVKQARADTLRAEVSAGVRTIDSYLTAIGEAPFDVPATRVLYVPAVGMLPIGRNDNDTQTVIQLAEQAQGLLGTPMAAQQQQMQGVQQAAANGAQAGVTAAQQSFAGELSNRAMAIAGKALDAIVEHKDNQPEVIETKAVDDDAEEVYEPVEVDERPLPEVVKIEEQRHPYATFRASIEGEMDGMLTTWSRRQGEDAVARLAGTKARKGTRHWSYQPGEQQPTELKALDPDQLVDPRKWADDIIADMTPMFGRVVDSTVKKQARALEAYGLVSRINRMGRGNPTGTDLSRRLFSPGSGGYSGMRQALVNDVSGIVRTAALNQSKRLQAKVAQMDADGASQGEIEAEIRRMTGARSQWRKALATNVTTTLVEGATTKAAEPVAEFVNREWRTERDERVRPTHKKADGQKRSGIDPFTVGGFPMLHPGDPTAPPELTANCRCWQNVTVKPVIPPDVTWP